MTLEQLLIKSHDLDDSEISDGAGSENNDIIMSANVSESDVGGCGRDSNSDRDLHRRHWLQLFGLTSVNGEDDKIIHQYQCSLTGSVGLVPGILFLTSNSLCFYAQTCSTDCSEELMSGHLAIRKSILEKKIYVRHFVLLTQNHLVVFDEHSDSADPVVRLNLQDISRIDIVDPNKGLFTIIASNNCSESLYKLKVDTSDSMKTWTQALQTAVSKAKNDGEHDAIKIILPFSFLEEVSILRSNTVDSSVVIKLRKLVGIIEDEYLFTEFNNDIEIVFREISSELASRQKVETTDNSYQIRRLSVRNTSEERLATKYQDLFPDIQSHESIFACNLYLFMGESITTFPRFGKLVLTESEVTFRSPRIGFQTSFNAPYSKIHLLELLPKKSSNFWCGVHMILKDKDFWFEFLTIQDRELFIAQVRTKIDTTIDILKSYPESYPNFLNLDNIHFHDSAFAKQDALSSPQIEQIMVVDDNSQDEKPLKISLLTIGSRGDVQPMIALGKGLAQKGHQVKICTHSEYQNWIESHGLEFVSIAGNPSDIIQVCVEKGLFTLSFIKEAFVRLRGWIDDLFESSLIALQGSDLIIESTVALIGYHIAEKLQIPYMATCTMPWSRTSEFPHPFAVSEYLGLGYNRITWYLMETILWKGLQYNFNKFRREKLGLPPLSSGNWLEIQKVPLIYNFSQHVVKKPRDWGNWIHLSGYWFLDSCDADWRPEESLQKFISDRNMPIIYIGFGSMVVSDPDELTRTIVSAVNKAGVKAVISKGWSNRKRDMQNQDKYSHEESNVYFVSSVPHDWLFPQMDAVVHHGGAGTTAAGLRFGIPSIIKPFFGDQYFWASRVVQLGVGCWAKRLESQCLSDCIREAVFDEDLKQRAKILGQQIRSENGVESAIKIIEEGVPILRRQLEVKKYQSRELVPNTSYSRRIRNSLWSLKSRKSDKLSPLKEHSFELEPVVSVASCPESPCDMKISTVPVHFENISPKDLLIKVDKHSFFTSIHSPSIVSTDKTEVITATSSSFGLKILANYLDGNR